MWFLAGIGFAEPYQTAFRSCTVPAGKMLFLPVIDAWVDNLNCPGQPSGTTSAQDLASTVAAQEASIVSGSQSVTIDGTSVPGLTDSSTIYRATAGAFSYRLTTTSILNSFCPGDPFPAGTTPPPPGAYADGVYLMLAPLSPGVHHLHWTAQETGGPLGSTQQDVTYVLTVQG